MKAPFPFFGGKSRVSHLVWPRFGQLYHYIEPFAGSLAILLNSPYIPSNETVNDLDSYISNFWRALQHNPEEVAYYADYPILETDLHARHTWLINQGDFRNKMLSDPDYYDAKIAGWWVWGISCWIGRGWCDTSKARVPKQTPRLTGNMGINSGNILGVPNQLPGITYKDRKGIRALELLKRFSRPHLTGRMGVNNIPLYEYMYTLAERLRNVRVCCGDWSRIVTPAVIFSHGVTGILLDPPYPAEANRDSRIYSNDDLEVAWRVREWALENGNDTRLRIALCGYDGIEGYDMPINWEKVSWKAQGGYGNQGSENENRFREVIWFSHSCIKPQEGLF